MPRKEILAARDAKIIPKKKPKTKFMSREEGYRKKAELLAAENKEEL